MLASEILETRPLRVIVVDSSEMHSQLLADGMERIGQLRAFAASNPADVLEAAVQGQLDVVVISSRLDEPGQGFELLRKLRSLHPDLPAVMLLESSKRDIVVQAFRAGARGVLGRHASLPDLCKCVRCVYEGQVWASSEEMLFILDVLANSPDISAVDHQGMDLLSDRELEVVRSLAEGLTNREIGERLGLSRHTVKNYLFRVFDKVGVSSRMELLHLTMRQSIPQRTLQQERTPASEFEACRKEAEDGSPEAQLALAEMYANGEGTATDYAVAYMWCLRSERALADLRERVNAAKAQVIPRMNSEDVLEAQQPREWLKGGDEQCSALPPRPVAVEKESAKFSTA